MDRQGSGNCPAFPVYSISYSSGVGKVYVQVVVDVFCSIAFEKLYNSKMPITACDLLYDRVLPFYETLGVPVGAILTDNGREFCGRLEVHPYELLTAMEGIEHRTTKVRAGMGGVAIREQRRNQEDVHRRDWTARKTSSAGILSMQVGRTSQFVR